MADLRLRVATPDDAEAVADIYRPYVEETAVTFEEAPPDGDEMEGGSTGPSRSSPGSSPNATAGWSGTRTLGPLRDRPAYRWMTELSAYLARGRRGDGVGSALYRALLETLERQSFASPYSVVTVPNPESVGFHESFGFEQVGRFPDAGYKRDEWHDVAWYDRGLGGRSDAPADPTPFAECRHAEWLPEVLSAAANGGDVG